MLKKLLCLILPFCLSFTLNGMEKSVPQAQAKPIKVLVFDLGGVFFGLKKKTMGMAGAGDGSKLLGIFRVLKYGAYDRQNPFTQIKKKFYAVLDHFPFKEPDGFIRTCDDSGTPLPYALCHYQAGKVSAEKMRQLAEETCATLKTEGFFVSDREEALVRATLRGTFTPAHIAAYNYVLPDAVALLKQIAQLKNEDESKKYIIMGLSNWDGDSFEMLAQEHKDVIECFDHLFISARTGITKPNDGSFEEIFTWLKEHNINVTPEQVLFLDDQPENVKAGNKFMTSVKVGRDDYESLAQALVDAGIIKAIPEASTMSTKTLVISSLLALGFVGAVSYMMSQS